MVALLIANPQAMAEEREYIYGAELMSPKERDTYRQGLQSASSDEAKEQYRQRHRERLQKRAQQRGMQFGEKGIIRREGSAQ